MCSTTGTFLCLCSLHVSRRRKNSQSIIVTGNSRVHIYIHTYRGGVYECGGARAYIYVRREEVQGWEEYPSYPPVPPEEERKTAAINTRLHDYAFLLQSTHTLPPLNIYGSMRANNPLSSHPASCTHIYLPLCIYTCALHPLYCFSSLSYTHIYIHMHAYLEQPHVISTKKIST